MNQRPSADRYVVEGRGAFPLDMLRKDSSVAATDEDQRLIDATYGSTPDAMGTRRVALLTSERETTDERWVSFGWRVVRPLRPWSPMTGYYGPEPTEDVPVPDLRHVVTMRVVCANACIAAELQRRMSDASLGMEGTRLEPSCIEPFVEYQKRLDDELAR